MKEKIFSCIKDCQLRLTFKNGNSMSSIWGFGSYSDNHSIAIDKIKSNIEEHSSIGTWFKKPVESNTIEVMYDCSDKKTLTKIRKKFGDDNPIGYMGFKDWLSLINILKDK